MSPSPQIHRPIRFGLTGFGVFDASRHVGPCVWPHVDILTIHDGEIALRIQGAAEIVGSGESVLIYPQTPFGGESTVACTRASVIHVALRDEPAGALPSPLAELAGLRAGYRRARLGASVLEHDIPRLVALAARRETAAVLAIRVALLQLIVGEFAPQRDPGGVALDPRIQPALDRVAADLATPPTVAELAALCGLSVSHFRAVFGAAVGRSPGDYVQTARLSLAAQLLRETALPVKAVAAATGYASVKDLYRAFTPRFGTPPAAYRREHQPVG